MRATVPAIENQQAPGRARRLLAALAGRSIAAVLVAINLVAWVVVAAGAPGGIGGGLVRTHGDALLLRFGAADLAMVRAGGWWRVLAAQFLHSEPLHLIFNLLVLALFGAAFERRWTSPAFALLFLVSGTVGTLASVMAMPVLVSSGASPALMGLAGGATVDLLRHRSWAAARPYAVLLVAGFVAIQTALDVAVAGYPKPDHVAGLLAGLALGWLLPRAGRDSTSAV